MRHAIIDRSLTVINIIKWDGISKWNSPIGTTVIQSDVAQIGDIYDPKNDVFIPDSARIAKPDNQ